MAFCLRHLAHQCKKLATEILESCASLHEVEILLKEDAGAKKFFNHVETYSYPQLTLAVEHKHKEFVSHPYCQQAIEKHYLDNMKWEERTMEYKLLYLIMQSLFGLFSVMGYMIVRVPTIYYEYYHLASVGFTLKSRDVKDLTKTQRLFYYLRSTKLSLDIPFNRFICHTLSYGIFLIILGLTAMSHTSQPRAITWNYILIFVYSCGLMLHDVHILWRSSWEMFSTFWHLYFSALHIMLNFAFTLKVIISYCEHSELIEDMELLVHTCYALATIVAIMGFLYWFQLNEKIGPIIIQLSHVLTDFATNFMVLLTVYAAFLIGIFFLIFGWNSTIYHSEYKRDVLNRLAIDMGWALLNPGPIELGLPEISIDANVNISGNFPDLPHNPNFPKPEKVQDRPSVTVPGNITIPGNFTIPEELLEFLDGAHRLRYNFITYTLYAYQLITVVLLLNLLIAAMSSTVQRLQAQNDMNWKFYRTRIQITYFEQSSAMPVPFNMVHWVMGSFYYLFACFYFLWRSDKRFFYSGIMHKFDGHRTYKSDFAEDRKRYSDFMTMLIKRHLQLTEMGKIVF